MNKAKGHFKKHYKNKKPFDGKEEELLILKIVGDTGFEPATSSTPRKRASQSAPIPDIPLSLYLQ